MTVNATLDPEGATAAFQAAVQQTDFNPESLPPSPSPAQDCSVHLPGGFFDAMSGEHTQEATVRELNGEDEEYIDRMNSNLTKYFDAILNRGVSYIGDAPATPAMIDSLLSGDRDWLLLQIRRVTFGDAIELTNVTCPHCQEEQEATIYISKDVPIDGLDGPRNWTMTLASGKIVDVVLPDGSTAKAMAAVDDRNAGTLNTVLLSKCVTEIDGSPVLGRSEVSKGLTIRDRREIIAEIGKRNPGPRFAEVSRPCLSCGEKIPLPLGLLDLFLI